MQDVSSFFFRIVHFLNSHILCYGVTWPAWLTDRLTYTNAYTFSAIAPPWNIYTQIEVHDLNRTEKSEHLTYLEMGGSWRCKRFFSTELIYIVSSSASTVSRIISETFHNFHIKSLSLKKGCECEVKVCAHTFTLYLSRFDQIVKTVQKSWTLCIATQNLKSIALT